MDLEALEARYHRNVQSLLLVLAACSMLMSLWACYDVYRRYRLICDIRLNIASAQIILSRNVEILRRFEAGAWHGLKLSILVCATFGGMTGCWIFFWKKNRRDYRRTFRACEQCGYNLTANTSGICPECGTAVSKQSKAIA